MTNLFFLNKYKKNDNIYCIICRKYKEFKNPLILKFFEKALILSIICGKYGSEDEKLFKKEKSTKILNIVSLTEIYNYFQNMATFNYTGR